MPFRVVVQRFLVFHGGMPIHTRVRGVNDGVTLIRRPPFPFLPRPQGIRYRLYTFHICDTEVASFCWQAAQRRPLRIDAFNIVFFGEFCAVGGVVGDHTALAVAHEENLGAGLGTCVFQGLVYHFLLGGQFPVFTSTFPQRVIPRVGVTLEVIGVGSGYDNHIPFLPRIFIPVGDNSNSSPVGVLFALVCFVHFVGFTARLVNIYGGIVSRRRCFFIIIRFRGISGVRVNSFNTLKGEKLFAIECPCAKYCCSHTITEHDSCFGHFVCCPIASVRPKYFPSHICICA